MSNILIVGCGSIGQQLGEELVSRGHMVSGLKRNPTNPTAGQIDYIKADISRPSDLKALKTDFDIVYFIVSADRRNINSYHDVYVTGLNNLTDHFKQHNSFPRWIFVSSTSVYGQNQGEWIDENSPTIPTQKTSDYIVAAENKIRVLNPDNIIVRFSGIYGPGREYLINLARNKPTIQRVPPYFTNRIHERDCIGVLLFLFEKIQTNTKLDNCYLASDDAPVPQWDIVSWLSQHMGCKDPIEKPVDNMPDMNKRCRNMRLKQLGYRFIHPDFKSGYGELIEK